MIAEGGGGVLETGELFAAHFFLFLAEDFRIESLAMFEQMPEKINRSSFKALASQSRGTDIRKPVKLGRA